VNKREGRLDEKAGKGAAAWKLVSFSFSLAGIFAVCRCASTVTGPSQSAHQGDSKQQDPTRLPLLWLTHPHPEMVRAAARPLPVRRGGKGRFPALSSLTIALCGVVRFKNGQGNTLDGGNYKAHENGSLEMNMARKEDQGIYTCVATNILGKAEAQVRLEVKGRATKGSRSKQSPGSFETCSRNNN